MDEVKRQRPAAGAAQDAPHGLGEGAARAAPTAPHATPSTHRTAPPSGPERFWSRGPARVGLSVGLALSVLVHIPILPLGSPSLVQVRDVDGEAAIPIDMLSAPEPPAASAEVVAPPPPPPAEEAEREPSPAPHVAPTHPDAGAPDAASPKDAGLADALPERDSGIPSGDGGADLDGASKENAPLAVPALVAPELVLVTLVVSTEVIRRAPLGATIGLLLRQLPQWRDFMSGTTLDPIQDVDWIMVSGPSLVNTGRDVVLLHYSAPDSVIDRAVSVVAHGSGHGGPVDAGVPHVPAVHLHADRADRWVLRPQPHILVVTPPSDGPKIARQLVSARIKSPMLPGDAVSIRLVKPQRPFPELPDSIAELRLRVVPRPDQGADVLAEGDTPDAASAAQAAVQVTAFVRRHDDVITSLLTHGILSRVVVRSEGNRVTAHLSASRDQVETVVALAASLFGIDLPPSAPTSPAGTGGSLGGSPNLR